MMYAKSKGLETNNLKVLIAEISYYQLCLKKKILNFDNNYNIKELYISIINISKIYYVNTNILTYERMITSLPLNKLFNIFIRRCMTFVLVLDSLMLLYFVSMFFPPRLSSHFFNLCSSCISPLSWYLCCIK